MSTVTDADIEAAYPIVGTVYRLTGLGMSGMAEVQGMVAQAIANAREAGERAGAERENRACEQKLRKDADQRWIDGYQELSDELRNQAAWVAARRRP